MSETNEDVRGALAGALAKAQGQFRAIVKNRDVFIKSDKGSYKFRYADMEELISATRPALSANGLAVIQSVGIDPQGQAFIDTVLAHSAGGERFSRMPIPSFTKMDDPKRFGAAMSYLRRYQYSAILCLAADDDLEEDGQGVEDKPEQRQRQAPRAAEKAEGQAASAGEVNWVKKKLAALKLGEDFLREAHGVELGSMTSEQFAAVKADLLAR